MCLAVPGKILEIKDTGDPLFRAATVSFGGVLKEVSLAMLPEAKTDDYVMVHVGVAMSVIDEEEALETIAALRQMGEAEFYEDS
jgi:hydrogenase expression/formation protein HypC